MYVAASSCVLRTTSFACGMSSEKPFHRTVSLLILRPSLFISAKVTESIQVIVV